MADDEELLQEVIELFFETVDEQMSTLEQLLEGGRLEDAQRLAHGLKGAASNIGADRFSATAFKLENGCKQQQSSEVLSLAFADLKEILDQTFSVIEEHKLSKTS